MNKKMRRSILALLFLIWTVEAIAQPPSHFMGARWGISIEEARAVIKSEAKRISQDRTAESDPVLYAKGLFLGSKGTFAYFFTPKSKKLYRVDVILDNAQMYEKARAYLSKRFDNPTSSQPGGDSWSWEDKSYITLQKEANRVILSYSSGKMREGMNKGKR